MGKGVRKYISLLYVVMYQGLRGVMYDAYDRQNRTREREKDCTTYYVVEKFTKS